MESGYRVILTRETDTYMTKEQRAEAANRYGADAFVSIHQNTYEEEEPTGIETWYDGTDPSRDSRRLALLIHEETVKRTGAKERRNAKSLPRRNIRRSWQRESRKGSTPSSTQKPCI